jgi:uncharacterized protein UPF0160
MENRIIVSHVSPDWDAICSLWLLQRFGGFADAEIALVNTGTPDVGLLARASAVVDTGRVLDPEHHRFDHHQLPGNEASSCCAASLVFQWLKKDAADLEYLAPLIDLIYAGDTGKPAADLSRKVGIHAILSTRKAAEWSGMNLIGLGYALLDDIAAHLKHAHEARATLDRYTVYRSRDGLVIALDGAPQHATTAAFEASAQLVVWHNPQADTIGVGINRARESGIDCGVLIGLAAHYVDAGALFDELMSWYRHPSGFCALRGSAKAPDARPLGVPIAEIAAALDAAWVR